MCICIGHLLLDMALYSRIFFPQYDSVRINQFFICKWLYIGEIFMVRDGGLVYTSFLCTWTSSGTDLWWSCAHYYKFCDFICISFLLCPQVLFLLCPSIPLSLIVFLPPLSQSFMSPGGRDSMNTSHLGLYLLILPSQSPFLMYLKLYVLFLLGSHRNWKDSQGVYMGLT